jgi:hypothetical protein
MELPFGYYREHAAFRARHSASGIGAAVVDFSTDHQSGQHRWSCLVSDGRAFRYVEARSADLGPWERLPPSVVADAIERFAATLPEQHRLYHLVKSNPLHLTRNGVVHR